MVTVEAGYRPEDARITRRPAARALEDLPGQVRLFLEDVGPGHQDLSAGGRLDAVRTAQELKRPVRVVGGEKKLTREIEVIGTLGIRCEHLQQRFLGIVGTSHPSVRLGHSR